MLACDHSAEPREIRLGLVRAHAVQRVSLRVVDAVRVVETMQRVPMAGLVGMHNGTGLDDVWHERDALGLCLHDERHGASLALPHGDDDTALAGLMLSKATVNAILGAVRRADVP